MRPETKDTLNLLDLAFSKDLKAKVRGTEQNES